MRSSLSFVAAFALALTFGSPASGQDSPSLGDLARQAQKNRDKDKASKPAKVFTNDDVASGSGGMASALGGSLGQLAQTPAGGDSSASASPAERLAQLETFVEQASSLDKATLVRSVLKDKSGVDFPGRAKWEDRLYAAKQEYVAQLRELIQRAKQIVASADSLKGTQDPNDPRVKALGAKLQTLARDAVQIDSAFQVVVIEGNDLASQTNSH